MLGMILISSLLSWTGAQQGPTAAHGLHYEEAAMVWDEAMPLGNGILGALVWGDGNPLIISMDRTDLWDLRPVPEFHSEDYRYSVMQQWEEEKRYEELAALYEKPYRRPGPTKIPAGRIRLALGEKAVFEEGVLDIREAEARLRFSADAKVRVWVHAVEAVGIIACEGVDLRPELIAPAFGGKEPGDLKPAIVAGEVSELGYEDPLISSGENWSAYTQRGWGDFSFAVYLGWKKTDKGFRGAWSVASSFEGDKPFEVARKRVQAALGDEEEKLTQSHRAWWREYWGKSGLSVPDAVIERQWYLDTYKFGAASRKGAPPITLQGPWTADNGKLPPWKGDYHHDLNTELSYWPCYSGNRLEEGENFVTWLWDTRPACRDWTQRFFEKPGMTVPMTCDLNNNQIGGWRQYTHSATCGAWLSHHFYLHWKYSADENFLRDRAYPYLKESATFIEAVTEGRDDQGKRSLPLSSSPEINDNKPNAWFKTITNYDLALCRWLMQAAAEMAQTLALPQEADHWRQVEKEFPDFGLGKDSALLIAKNYPLADSHRHFSHLLAIHPLGLIDFSQGEEAQQCIRASLADLKEKGTKLWTGYSFAWLASLAARGRDGDLAAWALRTFPNFTLRNSFHCNGDQSGTGLSNFTYRPFTLEGNFAAAAGLQEMLLQSHTGVIEVFPAIPQDWKELSFHSLRAMGAFLVSAQKIEGKLSCVRIESEKDGLCRVRSPFSGAIIEKEMKAGEAWEITS